MFFRSKYEYRKYQVISIFTLIALLYLNLGRSSDPPSIVQNHFQEKYGNADHVKDWKKEGLTSWQKSFSLDGRYHLATFNIKGNWLSTYQQLYYPEIPKPIINTINKDYPHHYLEEIYSVITEKGDYFELVLKRRKSKVKLSMYSNGSLVRKL